MQDHSSIGEFQSKMSKVVSWLSETLLKIWAKMNVGNMSAFCFKVFFSFISLGSLSFFSTVTKNKNPNELYLRRVEKKEQKIS